MGVRLLWFPGRIKGMFRIYIGLGGNKGLGLVVRVEGLALGTWVVRDQSFSISYGF